MPNLLTGNYGHRFEWFRPQEESDLYFWGEALCKERIRDIKSYQTREGFKARFLMPIDLLSNPWRRDPFSLSNYRRANYSPLDDVTLFARFTEITDTEEDFLQWATEYGRLEKWNYHASYNKYNRVQPLIELQSEMDLNPRENWAAESFMSYSEAYNSLGIGVFLWECIRNKDEKLLHKILKVNTNRTRATILLPQKYNRRKRIREENTSTATREDGFFEDTLYDVRQKLNPMLYDYFRALDDFGIVKDHLDRLIAQNYYRYPVELRRDGKQFLQPSSLISFMWFQLGLAIDGKIRLRRCEVCGEWEDMENHRENWTKHPRCANNKCAERYRNKKRIGREKT